MTARLVRWAAWTAVTAVATAIVLLALLTAQDYRFETPLAPPVPLTWEECQRWGLDCR